MSAVKTHAADPAGAAEASIDDARLAEAIETYRRELRMGHRPDREALCARFPDLGQALLDCLDAVDFVHRATQDLSGPSARSPANATGPAAVRPAETLGDFRLISEVGRGGMGVVYEAEQISLRRRVALKVLPHAALLDARQLQRFHNEAQAAAALHHANIVPVYAVGTDRGVPYYAMQFVDGQTLAARIEEMRQARIADTKTQALATALTCPEAVSVATSAGSDCRAGAGTSMAAGASRASAAARTRGYCRSVATLGVQAALALDHAHQMGVVHRDVKPANLLLEVSGHLWVTDFGLATFLNRASLTATGDMVGTLRYMSPEQTLGRHGCVDHRTDIYSLGVTLYELIALEPPFDGDERHELLRQLLQDEPPPLRRRNPKAPVELEIIVGKAMAKNPQERYATAADLADDLARFLDDRPIRARRPALSVRGIKWARRHRSLVASMAFSMLALAAVTLIGSLLFAQHQHQLAVDRAELALDKERQERDAKHALYHALLGRATAMRLAREPGYRGRVWADLRQAVALGIPASDPEAMRTEVLACLGDPIGRDPTPAPDCVRVPRPQINAAFAKILRDVFQKKPVFAISADQRWLATAGGEPRAEALRAMGPSALLWNATSNVTAERLFLGAVYDMQFTPDGTGLIAGCEEGVIRWMIGAGTQSFCRAGTVTSVAVHPSGRLLATAGRRIELWSLVSNLRLASFASPAASARVEFSPDGAWLLAIVRDEIRMGWPVMRAPEKHALDGHRAGVPAVAFSPNGQLLASASKDQHLRLWDAATGRLLHDCLGHAKPLEAVAFSPDNQLVASGDIGGQIRIWDAATGRLRTQVGSALSPPGQIWRLQFAPNGQFLAAAGGKGIAVWALEHDGDALHLVSRPMLPQMEKVMVYDLAIHPNSKELVFLDAAGNVHAHELTGNAALRALPFKARAELRGLHFDESGRLLTFIDSDGHLCTWDWQAEVACTFESSAFQLALDPTGRYAATSSATQGVLICDVLTGREVLNLPPEGADLWSLAWTPDATRLAVGLSDGGVSIWDLEQVRSALADFGLVAPSTRRGGIR